jgi:hypothetical protein
VRKVGNERTFVHSEKHVTLSSRNIKTGKFISIAPSLQCKTAVAGVSKQKHTEKKRRPREIEEPS